MKKKLVVVLIFGASLVLAACGSSDSPATASKFNKQDVTFAQQMIPHHRQAVEMAQLAETRASSPEVKSLALAIESAQDPEINKMTGWLKGWNKPVPDDSMSGMDHGSSGTMTGMMTDSEMTSLTGATGTAFDTMFLTMMIKHHQGAITMANDELASGKSADALALAKAIKSAQTSEISTMQGLLKK